MRKLLPRLIVALLIAGSLLAFYFSVSGSPPRVHLADAVSLIMLFVLPALLVRSPRDLSERWLPLLALVLAGAVLHSALSARVIAKAEFDVVSVLAALPLLLLSAALLLLIHGAIVARIELYREGAVSPTAAGHRHRARGVALRVAPGAGGEGVEVCPDSSASARRRADARPVPRPSKVRCGPATQPNGPSGGCGAQRDLETTRRTCAVNTPR